jgi:CHAT domain-containing protein
VPLATFDLPRRARLTTLPVVLCCLELILQAGCRNSSTFSERLAVAQRQSGWRATAGRLVGLAHAPYGRGGRDAARQEAVVQLRRARSGLRARVSRGDPEPAAVPGTTADAALLELAAGHPDDAVSRLTAEGGPPALDAGLWNELAVAYLDLADAESNSSYRVQAIEACSRALDVEPRSLAARFNLAVALEKLDLPGPAAKAWDDYLRHDPGSGWAAEARQRLAALPAPRGGGRRSCGLEAWRETEREAERAPSATPAAVEGRVAACPWAARDFVAGELLPRWAADRAAGRAGDAARRWALLDQIGAALAHHGPDLLISDTVRDLAAADTVRGARIAAALVTYQTGLRYQSEWRTRLAATAFGAAAAGLARAGSPFAGWATLQHAIETYFLDYDAASAELTGLAHRVSADRHPVLAGRVQRMLGLICMVQAKSGMAQRYYENALADCERGQDPEYAASLHALLAEALSYIGDSREAWLHRQIALTAAVALPDSPRLQTLLNEVAEAALHAGAPHAARLIQAESLAVARRLHDPLYLFDALLRRIAIDRVLGDRAGLEAERDEAAAQARLIPDPDLRQRNEGELQAAYARAQPPGPAAVASYAKAVRLFAGTGKNLPLVGLLAEQARASEAIGDLDGAAAALAAGLSEADSQRGDLATAEKRRSFFDQARPLFDEAVAFSALRRQDQDAAFLYAELGRSRTLLDAAAVESADRTGTSRVPAPTRRPRPAHSVYGLAEISELLAPGEVLVEYSVVEGHLLRWTVRPSGAKLSKVPIERADLEARCRAFRAALSHPQSDPRSGPLLRALDLYRLLVPNTVFAAGRVDRLIIVPDREIEGVPFAALLDPDTNRFLVEQAPLVVAPSASFYVHRGRPAGAAGAVSAGSGEAASTAAARPAPQSALVLGDPDLGASFPSRFPRLPAARSEAENVAALYPRSNLLLGGAARKSTFLAAAANYEIIHYAGHSSAADDQPLLLLAGDSADSGVLSGSEIESLRLAHTRLVVLATCRGGSGVVDAAEGPMSAARAFLAAGAPAVVASLTDLDDVEAEHLFITLHRSIASGLDPAAALRAAQLAAIADIPNAAPSRRFDWAALQLVGGRPSPAN